MALRHSYITADEAAVANVSPNFTARPVRRAKTRLAHCDLADGQLVTLALNGDTKAFPELMRRYGGKLRGIIGKRVPYPDEADELAQDTLLSAWAALQTYPAARPFEIWLVCIALNKCRDWGRRRSVRHRAAAYLADWGPACEPSAETCLVEHEGEARLDLALSRLPDALGASLKLTALQGLSQKEAAERLGITAKAVETRVRRAKLRLRAEMAQADCR